MKCFMKDTHPSVLASPPLGTMMAATGHIHAREDKDTSVTLLPLADITLARLSLPPNMFMNPIQNSSSRTR